MPRTPEEEAKVTDWGFRYYAQMRGVTSEVQLQALDYLTKGDKKQARKAITSMLDTLRRTNFGTKNDLSRASGSMLMVGGMVYDWCYDQMKPKEREEYVKAIYGACLAHQNKTQFPPQSVSPIRKLP